MHEAPAHARLRFSAKPSFASDFVTGLTASPLAARYLIGQPSLWKYIVIGGAITVGIFVAFASIAVTHAAALTNALFTLPPSPAPTGTVLWWVLAVLSGGALLALAGVLALIASQVLIAPLYSRLSERVERSILAEGEFEETVSGRIRDELQGVAHSILTVVSFGAVMIPILLLNVIPFFGSLAAVVLGGAFSAFVLAFEFGDNSLSRRKARWMEKMRQAVGELAVTMGLGIGIALMMLIPVVDFFLVPVAVVAGTMVFCGLHEAGRIRVSDRRIPKGTSSRSPAA
jgi:CysZ protein